MWKKDAELDAAPQQHTDPSSPRQTPAPRSGGGAPANAAAIGRSITIRGDVTGDEDLLIQGRVEGSVDLEQHAVTVGPEGDVKASIRGRIVTVEGSVKGNLTATEQIILRSSARVQGDIAAPRVVLEDGANFRGGVDMGEPKGVGTGGARGSSSGGTAGDRNRDAKGDSAGDARSGGRGADRADAAGTSPQAGAGSDPASGSSSATAGADASSEAGAGLEKGKGSGASRPQVAR